MPRNIKAHIGKRIVRARWLLSSLRARLLLLLVLTLLPTYGLILYSALQSHQRAATDALADAAWLTRVMAVEQEAVVESARDLLRALAQIPFVRRPDSAELCNQTFADIRKQNPIYLNIAVIDADGLLRCSALPFTQRIDFSDRNYFRAAMEQRDFVVGDYQIGRLTGRGTVTMADPVLDAAGNTASIVVVAIDFSALIRRAIASSALPGNLALPEGSSVTIVDERGMVYARHPDADKWVGRAWPNAPVMKTIRAQRQAGTTREKALDGVERFYAFAPFHISQNSGIYLLVGIPTSTVLAETQQLFAGALASMALIAAVVVVAAWIGSTALILRPMAALMAAARRLGGGDLNARTGLAHTNDEFGQLARGFDDMASALARRQIEAERAEARFGNIIDLSADAIISMGDDQRILIFNQGAEHIFGYSATEMLGQQLHRLLSKRSLRAYRKRVRELVADPRQARWTSHQTDIVGKRKDGREFPAEASISRTMEDGKPILTAFLRDISARRQAEEEIRELNVNLEQRVRQRTAELQAANEELESFSYSVSHDLRAPLRAIDGFSQAVVEDYADQLDDQAKDYLNRVRAATQRMGQLIDDILGLARVTRVEMRVETVDLSALAASVADDIATADPGRKADWRIESGLRAQGDPRLLRVALVNLLDNAWKYSARQSQGEIAFGANSTAQNATEFFVSDNGVGFDMAHADRLFGAFQRLHSMAEFPGTGIGLATVRRIVNRHGGQIRAESTPEQGATFYFTLPA